MFTEKIYTPKSGTLQLPTLYKNRNPIAVFVMKHDLQQNTEAVRNTTESIDRSDSNRWLFLIEGHTKYVAQENRYLDEFIETVGVKTEDPIYNPFTREVAIGASVDPCSAALAIFVIDFLDLIDMNNTRDTDGKQLEELINSGLESVSRVFEIDSKALKKKFETLDWTNKEKLSKQVLELADIRKTLIGKSNTQSRLKLDSILNSSQHPCIFIMSGIEHEPVFTQ